MQNLFRFISKHYYLFLFILLEGIAIGLYINNSFYQRTIFVNATNNITGGINQSISNIQDYLYLKNANKILVQENADFRNRSENSFIRIDQMNFEINDSVYKQYFEYTGAKVISNSVNKRNNFIMLNKGRIDGIEKDMAVISPKGVVGIVKEVSINFSALISVLHKDFMLSVKIKKNNYVGTLSWDGKHYQYGILKDIPFHVSISKGDTIVTSGYSLLFPENIMVGTIQHFNINEGDNFYSIKVNFSEDYNKLAYVYVVKNLRKTEQDELLKQTLHE